jgi:hypothetical protein
MKRNQAFPPNYLGKDDVRTPIAAVIEDVRSQAVQCEHGMEQKPVMTFAGGQIKPLIINMVNWQICEDAYGEDSDSWRQKPIEIYLDPSVMFGGRRVGGIRLRVPQQHPGRPAAAPAPQTGAAQPAQTEAQPQDPPPLSQAALAQKLAEVLQAFDGAANMARLDQLATASQRFAWTPEQEEQIDARYRNRRAQIEGPRPARPSNQNQRRTG